ncbi:alkaline phosphatase family protein [Catenuloplanes japonicus]|uniref:alkaline phosphatase family protein n=1 Tax=Catenuloplanes japonicus TaxID=33876 RepID=UPI000526BC5D|nr:nucleotide pyrophosphatase/phosphodiesterase family protein [Catenuloplanes japonicus]
MSVVRPAYGRASLADVLPSALAVLGVAGSPDPLALTKALPGVRRIAVLLVDGFGTYQLPAASAIGGTIADLSAGRLGSHTQLTSGFPSTTPVSLVTLGTGAPPGEHGVLGIALHVPGTDRVFDLLHWGDDPDPAAWQPVPTQLERAATAGVRVTLVTRPEFDGSGLTTAANRGGAFRGASDVDELVTEILGALSGDETPVLVSAYYREMDKAGHLYGLRSPEWAETAADVDALITRLADGLPDDAALLVTADHGQIDVPWDRRYDLDTDPRLSAGVRLVAGEPRVRYLHVEPGAEDDVIAAWRAVLGADAEVVSRAEAVAGGWFGPVAEGNLARIGDVVVTMRDVAVTMASEHDPPVVSTLIAFHGANTAAEMSIPLFVVRKP